MTEQPVLVYYKPGCPYSAALLARMKVARIPYRSVRFRDDEEGASAVREHHPQGWELSPTVVVDGRYLSNPSLAEVRAALADR